MDLTEVDMVVTTEHKREDVIFQAHPNYCGNGPWCDWAMFCYETSDYDKKKNKTHILGDDDEVHLNDSIADPHNFHCAPGKLLGFVKLNKEEHAIVMQCECKHKKSGVFSTYWKLEYSDKRNQ